MGHKNRISVKVTLNTNDPFDSEIIRSLEKEKNRAGFIRKAVFCYISGLGPLRIASASPPAHPERDQALNKKLAKLTEL